MPFTLEISKDNFKFSASHFAIFGPYCGELMHGHNYYVSVKLETHELDPTLGLAVEFNEIKPLIKAACEEWDECILFPNKSPYLKIELIEDSYKVVFNKKTYVLPKEDVNLIEALNISVEELSKLMWIKLVTAFKKYDRIKKVYVTIEETRGQKGTYTD